MPKDDHPPSARLQKLQEQQDKLKARHDKERKRLQAQIKNARARESQRKHRMDTRRKIIAGALALTHTEKNPDSEFARIMLRLIDEYVTKDNERDLFGLPPRDKAITA